MGIVVGAVRFPHASCAGLTLIAAFLALVLTADGPDQITLGADHADRVAQYCAPKPASDGADAPNLYCLNERGFLPPVQTQPTETV